MFSYIYTYCGIPPVPRPLFGRVEAGIYRQWPTAGDKSRPPESRNRENEEHLGRRHPGVKRRPPTDRTRRVEWKRGRPRGSRHRGVSPGHVDHVSSNPPSLMYSVRLCGYWLPSKINRRLRLWTLIPCLVLTLSPLYRTELPHMVEDAGNSVHVRLTVRIPPRFLAVVLRFFVFFVFSFAVPPFAEVITRGRRCRTPGQPQDQPARENRTPAWPC